MFEIKSLRECYQEALVTEIEEAWSPAARAAAAASRGGRGKGMAVRKRLAMKIFAKMGGRRVSARELHRKDINAHRKDWEGKKPLSVKEYKLRRKQGLIKSASRTHSPKALGRRNSTYS